MGAPGEEFARAIARNLRAGGHSAYLVGGCVRDLLLGLPAKDFDVATSARPDEILALYPRAQLVGVSFGVVLIAEGGAAVEVATYRSDHAYHDGRRPETVTFETDPQQDVLRRDFTVNALLLDPDTGEIIDHVGGRRDLELRLIRAIGQPEKRMREDHLRLLRAVRFAARLGFDLESETEATIVRFHPLVQAVAAERLGDELIRILTEGGARYGFELLDRTGLLNEILPEVVALKDTGAFTHTLEMLAKLRRPSPALAAAVLLHDVGAAVAREIMTRLRFANDHMRRVESLITNRSRFDRSAEMRESELKRLMRLPQFEEHLGLHRMEREVTGRPLDVYDFVLRKRDEYGERGIWPERLITGDDLVGMGVQPGPAFGRILDTVEDAQLDGQLHTRAQALEMARRLAEAR